MSRKENVAEGFLADKAWGRFGQWLAAQLAANLLAARITLGYLYLD